MNLERAIVAAASGMNAQSARLRVVAENLANRDVTGQSPGADPYRRRTVSFATRLDRSLGVSVVQAERPRTDRGDLPQRFEPSHPAADATGYVRLPNVNGLLEMMDMREAQRSYGANLAVLETTRAMVLRAIDTLR